MKFPLLLLVPSSLLAGTPSFPLPGPHDPWHPVPDEQMRPFEPDRPDKTNGAHTLDAGHVQLEMDAFSFTRDTSGGSRNDDYLWGNLNLRIGLTDYADLQLFLPSYDVSRTTVPNSRASGVGDLTVAMKVNFWGNGTAGSAGGLELFCKTPTGSHALSNGHAEGGLIALWGTDLPAGFGLGVNSGAAWDLNERGRGHQVDLFESISVSHDLVDTLSAYAEIDTFFAPKNTGAWQATADLGFVWNVAPNVQIDTGVNVGLTRSAPDVQTFVGLAFRY